jgi:hypothetical protein
VFLAVSPFLNSEYLLGFAIDECGCAIFKYFMPSTISTLNTVESGCNSVSVSAVTVKSEVLMFEETRPWYEELSPQWTW